MQIGCDYRKKRPIIKSIREKLIRKRFRTKNLRLLIHIYLLIYNKEKFNLARSKFADILSKLIANLHQLIIKSKILNKALKTL